MTYRKHPPESPRWIYALGLAVVIAFCVVLVVSR